MPLLRVGDADHVALSRRRSPPSRGGRERNVEPPSRPPKPPRGGPPRPPPNPPITTVAALVAILLAHLGAGLGLEFVDANSDETDDVGVDAHAPFHLGQGIRRRVDIEEGVVSLAVLLDFEGEVLQSPILLLGDLALAFFDDALEFFHQSFDLGLGDVLARQECMLVERHTGWPFGSSCAAFSQRSSLSLRRKAPIRPEKGPSGTQ